MIVPKSLGSSKTHYSLKAQPLLATAKEISKATCCHKLLPGKNGLQSCLPKSQNAVDVSYRRLDVSLLLNHKTVSAYFSIQISAPSLSCLHLRPLRRHLLFNKLGCLLKFFHRCFSSNLAVQYGKEFLDESTQLRLFFSANVLPVSKNEGGIRLL